MARRHVPALLTVAGTSAAGFALAAAASATRASAHVDRKLEPRVAFRSRSRLRKLADAASPLGKWYTLGSASVALGASLARNRKHRAGGIAIAGCGIAAALLSLAFDELLPQPPVPTGHRDEPNKAVFPSGHAFVSTAIALTTAYVLTEERITPARLSAPLAGVLPLANTALKLGARKHWVSDAAGGVAAGVALAALCCAAYEAMRA